MEREKKFQLKSASRIYGSDQFQPASLANFYNIIPSFGTINDIYVKNYWNDFFLVAFFG